MADNRNLTSGLEDRVLSYKDGQSRLFRYSLTAPVAEATGMYDIIYEDPLRMGFALKLEEKGSPLFTTTNYAYGGRNNNVNVSDIDDYVKNNYLNEVKSRKPILDLFREAVRHLFNPVDVGPYFKGHYIYKVKGFQHFNTRYPKPEDDKVIELEMYEDCKMLAFYVAFLYNNLSWSFRNMKELIPENLLRFNLVIKLYEVGEYAWPREKPPAIYYKLYGCQFHFHDSLNHTDEISIGGYGGNISSPSGLAFKIKYKSVSRIFNPVYMGAEFTFNDAFINLNLDPPANTAPYRPKNPSGSLVQGSEEVRSSLPLEEDIPLKSLQPLNQQVDSANVMGNPEISYVNQVIPNPQITVEIRPVDNNNPTSARQSNDFRLPSGNLNPESNNLPVNTTAQAMGNEVPVPVNVRNWQASQNLPGASDKERADHKLHQAEEEVFVPSSDYTNYERKHVVGTNLEYDPYLAGHKGGYGLDGQAKTSTSWPEFDNDIERLAVATDIPADMLGVVTRYYSHQRTTNTTNDHLILMEHKDLPPLSMQSGAETLARDLVSRLERDVDDINNSRNNTALDKEVKTLTQLACDLFRQIAD